MPIQDKRASAAALAGGAAMGALIRAHDWASTPLGAAETWPQSLRTAVGIMLESRFPMYIAWGPTLVQLYNDGYRPMLGSKKHPAALGGRGPDTFAEIWDVIGPMFAGVLEHGTAVGAEDWMTSLDREGYLEECYFTFSYSPIRDESGGVGGVLVTVQETTRHVLGARRLQTLGSLAASAAAAVRERDTWRGAAEVLAGNALDVPFALLYRAAGAAGDAPERVATAGWGETLPASFDDAAWPIAEVMATGESRLVTDLGPSWATLPTGPWPERPRSALVLPITRPGTGEVFGAVVLGVSARRALDDDYRNFLELAVGQIAVAVGNARAFFAEKRAVEVERAHGEATERLLAEARRATRAREGTLAVVSHDLRNPLAVIGTSADLLARAVGNDDRTPRLRRSVESIRRAVERMSRLIDDLLDIASIDAGSLSLDPQPHTVDELMQETRETFESRAAEKGVALYTEVAADVPGLVCDKGRVLQALGNLVANALKFTAPPGAVTVRATADQGGHAVRLSVQDDGPGIAAAMRPHIFDRHWHASLDNRTGHGLGLSIARGIVERHGGQIELDSRPGAGSTFWFSLPSTPVVGGSGAAAGPGTPGLPTFAASLPADPEDTFLRGGGVMGARTRAFDWSTTSLGAARDWPLSLRSSVSTMLRSPYPITMFWGPELVMLYNDAFMPIHGAKHPAVLGMPAPTGLAEAWGLLGPLVEGVLASGEALYVQDGAVVFERGSAGEKEEAYFTWSYIPTADEAGGIAGLFAIASETTRQVIGGRRLAVLRELSIRTALEKNVAAVYRSLEDVLAQAGADLPFALLYVVEGERAELVACAGLVRGAPAARATVLLHESPWPLAEVARAGRESLVGALDRSVGALPGGPWPQPATRALALPIPLGADAGSMAVLVAGLSPLRPLDDDYHSFLQLLARQVAASVASARAYEQERRRAEQLAELDRAKTAFFSNVSHEFRTPLTLILGPVEDALTSKERVLAGEPLALVRRNTLRLAKMVNTLLDFSRMEAGRAQATYVPTDLAAVTAGLASAFQATAEAAGVRLVIDCPPLPEPIFVDPEMWEKIVLNLVSNAVKYTHHGQIDVALRFDDDTAVLTVADTGVGIPTDALPWVFERFYRVRTTHGRSHEGTGIGLALVQELVKLHGGSVDVVSTLGEGATFTVRVPRGSAHLASDRLEGAAPVRAPEVGAAPFVEEARRWLVDPSTPVDTVADEVWRVPAAIAGARIVLVDDNADLRSYVAGLLGRSFAAVETASDGQQALASILARPPDLVLSDVVMPGLDGFGLVRALRGDARTRAIPIILLSARAGDESTVEGLGSGADDYLVKPFSARELLARVCTQLEMARVRREAARHELAGEELREAVRMRDDWLTLVGHELRTPVAALGLGVHALVRALAPVRASEVTPELLHARAHNAERLLRRLEDQVEALVSVADLVTGTWQVQREPVDLAALVAGLADEVRGEAERAGCALVVTAAAEVVGELDRARLRQAIAHLIDNAIKFGAGEPVVLAVAREGDRGVLTIVDHGRGVSAEVQARLFERFERAVSADHYGGFGLGLWAARHVVEALAGTIAVSETPGGGATFTVSLPLTSTAR